MMETRKSGSSPCRKPLLEQCRQLVFCRRLGSRLTRLRRRFPEGKIITEIAPVLVEHSFRLGFMAGIVGLVVEEAAVPADVEIFSTTGANLSSADLSL